MNVGKVFEGEFKASIPKHFYYLRINDPAVGFSGGNSQFAPKNPYDFILFDVKLYCLELKSTATSLTFWQERFEEPGKRKTFEIRKHQIIGLTDAAKHENVFAGFLFNFRKKNTTVYVPIHKFNEFAATTTKKSINCDDALAYGFPVDSWQLKVHYRYDIEKMCKEAIAFGKQ